MRHEIIRSKSIAKRLWFIRRNINSLLQVKKYPRWPWKRQIEGSWRQVTWRKIFNFGPIEKWNMLFAIYFSMCMVLHRSRFIFLRERLRRWVIHVSWKVFSHMFVTFFDQNTKKRHVKTLLDDAHLLKLHNTFAHAKISKLFF